MRIHSLVSGFVATVNKIKKRAFTCLLFFLSAEQNYMYKGCIIIIDPIYVRSPCVQVPIVPYGGATSIEGHTLAPHGGVCIDMTLMKVQIKQ